MNKKRTVFVGLSGGVDSAVSAAFLKRAGYDVVGVFIKTWHPDFIVCNEEQDRLDAMRVAAHLDIPFLTFDFRDVYKKEVADYMISEYKKGRTPNPDVMCNREVKFGAFFKKAVSMGADYVATGHYAQNKKIKSKFALLKGSDPLKDQSYFLWTLGQNELNKILFPVGGFEKSQVRKLARKFKLPVADKKDSQGICFLGKVDLKNFLTHYIKEKRGKVLNTEGKEIGFHSGVSFFTLGERRGFTITKKTSEDSPYYIVSKNIKKNILVVSNDKKNKEDKFPNKIILEKVNWISGTPEKHEKYSARVRYRGEFYDCLVNILNDKKAEVVFDKPIVVASGQSCVIYDGDVCLGGGVVV